MKSKSSFPRSRNQLFFSILSQIQSVPSQPSERKKTISHLFSTINFLFLSYSGPLTTYSF